MLLKDQVIVVTGGSEGIGWECSQAYAKAGAKVVILARSNDKIKTAVDAIGPDHHGIACDVSNENDVSASMQSIMAKYGRINAIHNNAGIGSPAKPLHETSLDEWQNLMNINLKSIYLTTRYGFEFLKQSKGCILNTSSLVGVMGQADHAAYTGTKGGVNTLTKSMALDYAPYGIRVNAVCPAGTWTPMLRKWCSEQENAASIEQYLDDIHPLGNCPEGDVIADPCVFLLSKMARFITGHILHVGGGAEIGYRR
ncbi:SDR family oxidoreductase [Verrucomicrobiaceae bacterium N1E253]|uniref:SDR family oxidoreductase n=1 Tax=Oceaniferula marina TaxID=2748318 RepID=A0A851GPV3_9BACT|nr:SDR family oxidoreductase [Oceaniferula marina]NWK56174.1 SDR family oxidoreductase [Oceaniferula marina]